MKLFMLIFITATLLIANEPTLGEKLKSHNLIVSKASLNKYSELISLIADSEAMNDSEKQERISKLLLYSKEDITKLFNILNAEKQVKNQLDKISQEELKELQIEQSKELIEELAKSIKISGESKPDTNSLLMGMYLAQIDNSDAIKIIERIGEKFGFIFQALNDLEPFCNLKNSDHKGSINTDFSRSRKNICVSRRCEIFSVNLDLL
jgi:geranylgeranyl pyrophosphate synthase